MSSVDPADWLITYLAGRGGTAPAAEVAAAAGAEGITESTLKRARGRAGVASERRGFGQGSVWSLPSSDLRLVHSGHVEAGAAAVPVTEGSGLLGPAVAESVEQLAPDDVDTAAVALAGRYAAVIDRAESAARDAEGAWQELDIEDIHGRRHLARLEAKVQAQEVLAELGPKLLAVLESLGATPVARTKLKGGAPIDGGQQQQSELDKLRERHGRRAYTAAAVDPAPS